MKKQFSTEIVKTPNSFAERSLWFFLTLLSVFGGLAVLTVSYLRTLYPYQLEECETVVWELVDRVVIGEPIYVKPSVEFIATLYPPVYMYFGAVMIDIFGASYFPLRLLSVLAMCGSSFLIVRDVWLRTRRWAFGIIAAGLFLVSFLWIAALAIQAPSYLAFCGPVMGVWVFSIPMAVGTSRVGLADRLARNGWMRASFSEEEALALGSLVLEADANHSSQRFTAGVAAGPIESKRTWVAEPASAEISLGQTRLRIPWVGNASTRAAEVTRGRISAQRLLLGIGMLLLLLVAALRRSFPG